MFLWMWFCLFCFFFKLLHRLITLNVDRLSSSDAGQPGLVVKQLARCFPSPLGTAVPGLNSAAWGRLLATGLQGAALRLNIEW